MRIALSIAGWDPCGGAGVLADQKTMQAHGVYALGAITAITVQNTKKVFSTHAIPANTLKEQVVRLLEDFSINGVKIGMLAEENNVKTVIELVAYFPKIPIVLDPVIFSSSGHPLLNDKGRELLREELLPLVTVVTPNLDEGEWYSGIKISNQKDMEIAGEKILDLGVANVILKGGHITGNPDDLWSSHHHERVWFRGVRVPGRSTHGTGCAFSSALTAQLALGVELTHAIQAAKNYVTLIIKEELHLGKGHGLPHHFAGSQVYKSMSM